MKLDNLTTWDGYTYDLYQKAAFGSKMSNTESDTNMLAQFKEKWIANKATLSEWLQIGPLDLNQWIKDESLSFEQREQVLTRQKHLYNLWLQARLQYKLLYKFNQVLELTPDQILPFAHLQLEVINNLLLQNEKPKMGYGALSLDVRWDIDFPQLYQKIKSPDFQHNYDIHSADNMVYLDEVLTYKTFLEAYIKDPIIEKERDDIIKDEITLDTVFPKTKEALKYVVFEVTYTIKYYKEHKYRIWAVKSANKCWGADTFRAHLKAIFREEYRQLLYQLMQYDFNTKESILLQLAEDLTSFREDLIQWGTYIEEEGEFNERETHKFKRLKKVGFNGTESASFAFNTDENSTYEYLLWKAEPFTIAAEEAINSFIRKLEDTSNYLDLIDFSMEVAAQSSEGSLSFEYVKKDTEAINITTLYNALKDGDYIEQSTSLPSFRNVFMGKKVLTPIIWTGTIGELSYMMKTLHTTQRKLKQSPRRLWEKVCHCFRKPAGISFDPNLLRRAKQPVDTSRLDRICANL